MSQSRRRRCRQRLSAVQLTPHNHEFVRVQACLEQRPALAEHGNDQSIQNGAMDVPGVEEMLEERHSRSVLQLAALPEAPMREAICALESVVISRPMRVPHERHGLEEEQVRRRPSTLVSPQLRKLPSHFRTPPAHDHVLAPQPTYATASPQGNSRSASIERCSRHRSVISSSSCPIYAPCRPRRQPSYTRR